MNGISSWTGTLTPQEIARLPWNAGVAPAGTAFDLPGRAALDFQEATGADPRKFREEMELTVSGLKGLLGGVPEQEVKAIESAYANAIPRFIQIALAGGDVQETESLLFDPLRNRAKSLFAEHRYRDVESKEPLVEWILRPDIISGRDITVRLTPSAFAQQFNSLPKYAQTNEINQAQLRGFGIVPAGGNVEAQPNRPKARVYNATKRRFE